MIKTVLIIINMTKYIKKITYLLLVLIVNYAAYSQNNSFGILVKTIQPPAFPNGKGELVKANHNINIETNSLNLFTNTTGPTQYFEEFWIVSNNEADIYYNFEDSSDNNLCYQSGTINWNLLTEPSKIITGCIAETYLYVIHVTSTDALKSKCPEDVIELNNGWNWQYSFDGEDWKDFAANFQAQRSISFKINELAGFENKTKVFFQAGFGTQFTNILPYDIIPCSPNVIGPIEPKNTSCAYNNDGIVALTFDRKLIENESFKFSFFKNNALITTPLYSVDAATNKKYTFSGLEAGNYYIKYQTFIGSQPTTVNKEPNPSFTINPATPLTFELQNPKNPSCFGAEDGSVEVLITSGIPKFFEVDGDSVIPEELGPNLYRIKNLKAKPDGYKIKVTDANNCIDTNANE